jgi:uncharacterized protein YqeY
VWSLTRREEHRLKVFENRVLRRMFTSNGEKVMGGHRKLHNEQFHQILFKMIKQRRMRWMAHVAGIKR